MTEEPGAMDELLTQMQRLQAELADAEAEASARAVVGSAGGGAVRVEISGEFSFDAVRIDQSIAAQGDAALLEDLVLAALRDGAEQLLELRRQAMGDAVGHALGSLFGGEGLGESWDLPVSGAAEGDPGADSTPEASD